MFLNKEVHAAFEVKLWPDAFNKEVHTAFEVHTGWVALNRSLIHVCLCACMYMCVVSTLHPYFSLLLLCDTVLLEPCVMDETQ